MKEVKIWCFKVRNFKYYFRLQRFLAVFNIGLELGEAIGISVYQRFIVLHGVANDPTFGVSDSTRYVTCTTV